MFCCCHWKEENWELHRQMTGPKHLWLELSVAAFQLAVGRFRSSKLIFEHDILAPGLVAKLVVFDSSVALSYTDKTFGHQFLFEIRHGLGGLSCFVKLFVPPRWSLDGRFPTPTRQMLVEMACNFDDCETTHSIALNPLRSFQLNFVTLLLACRPSKVWSGGSQCSSWWTLRSRDLLGSFWDSHSLLLSHVFERLPIHDVSCIWGRFGSLANLLWLEPIWHIENDIPETWYDVLYYYIFGKEQFWNMTKVRIWIVLAVKGVRGSETKEIKVDRTGKRRTKLPFEWEHLTRKPLTRKQHFFRAEDSLWCCLDQMFTWIKCRLAFEPAIAWYP